MPWRKTPTSQSAAVTGLPSTSTCFSTVPAARADHEDRGPIPQALALLGVRRGVVDALHRVSQVHLALDDVAPGGRARVLEVRENTFAPELSAFTITSRWTGP